MAKTLQLIKDDPWLEPYEADINTRYNFFLEKYKEMDKTYGTMNTFIKRYSYLGFNYSGRNKGWWYREWAPNAQQLWLIGDFNNWDGTSHPLEKTEDGIWEIFIPNGPQTLEHGQNVKVRILTNDVTRDRIPAYITRAVQDEKTKDFSGQIWRPEKRFRWFDKNFDPIQIGEPIIYEAHIGMATEDEKVGTYREFADDILPRIKKGGYNCLQLMAIQEHPYYGSFGYHVSNFYAPSSRFGTPDDLKYLINKAHKMGIAVIMDLVHSHAVKNISEGLADFDGSGGQYFHKGGRGYHTSWDSYLFDYSKDEVLRFLLSNVRYWMEEFHFDGFRFDGVTSMVYHHHGDMVNFDHYDKYFKDKVDWDAIRYLQLANVLTHDLKPAAITIAEDMSGMPGMARKVIDGGIGFDYRLGMGIPDYWIKTLKHTRDEYWNIHEIWDVLTNRRWKEKTIAYAESHDQSLVGDKTLAFWLMDKEMYWHMNKDDDSIVIDRGMALHKMIRLITASLGGEGYLNFIGNEFGHPEWVDFPREGNDWSYKYAKRQWSLADDKNLKYRQLLKFDQKMIKSLGENHVMSALPARQLNMDDANHVMVFERNNVIFVFNFHPHRSIFGYRFKAHKKGKYIAILNTDEGRFGGHNRIDMKSEYFTDKEGMLSVYITSRTALVLKIQ